MGALKLAMTWFTAVALPGLVAAGGQPAASPPDATDAQTLQQRIDAAQGKTAVISGGTYRLSSPLRLKDDTTLILAPDTILEATAPDISIIEIVGKRNVRVSGGTLVGAATPGRAAYVAGVKISKSSDVTVENTRFRRMQWAGVYVTDSSRCLLKRLTFRDHAGKVPNSSAIALLDKTNHCVAEDNDDRSGVWTSYFIQDTSNGSLPPRDNIVRRNVSRGATVYGAIVYIAHPQPYDSNNQVLDNDIADVSDANYGHGGSPIYVVGHGAGGTRVVGNRVANGCWETRDRQNAPAGISITNIPAGATPVLIQGNQVSGMRQGDGIAVVSSPGGAKIIDNVVDMPVENDGAGDKPGGLTLRGNALRIANSSNVTVTGGRYTQRGVADAIAILATSKDVGGVTFKRVSARTLPGARDEKGRPARGKAYRAYPTAPYRIEGVVGAASIR